MTTHRTNVKILVLLLTFFSITNLFPYTISDSLKYLGQATVKIKTVDKKVIYIDPYAGTDYADSADVILVTHQHSDHNKISLVKQKKGCVVISNAESNVNGVYKSFTVGNIKIDAVAASNASHAKSACVGFVIEVNGIKIYHSGDTSKLTEMAELAVRKIDYALLCMDGNFNMGPEEATQCADLIQAKYYIPIHTTTSPTSYSDAIVARFTAAGKLVVKIGQTIELLKSSTDLGHNESVPEYFLLEQNYPNPFNPSTTINYSISIMAHVTIKVFDILGKEISTLVNEIKPVGKYSVEFRMKSEELNSRINPANSLLPSGIYFCRLQACDYSSIKKMLLLK